MDTSTRCLVTSFCTAWLPAARQALHLRPGDPLYLRLTAEAKARAEHLMAAQQPEPATEPAEMDAAE